MIRSLLRYFCTLGRKRNALCTPTRPEREGETKDIIIDGCTYYTVPLHTVYDYFGLVHKRVSCSSFTNIFLACLSSNRPHFYLNTSELVHNCHYCPIICETSLCTHSTCIGCVKCITRSTRGLGILFDHRM